MNKNYLGILFAAIILLSMSQVYASIGVGSWVDNNNVVLSINAGQTAEFRYGVTAVSLYGGVVGKYSIMLYREGVSTPIVKYVDNKATVGNGAIGRFNVTPSNYSNAAGKYYILINSSDKFSSDSFRLNLNVSVLPPTNNTNTTNTTSLNVACIASPVNGYAPLNVALTAVVSGATQAYSYSWDYNDGQPIIVQSTNQNSISTTHLYNIGSTSTSIFNPTIKVIDSNNNIVTANCSSNGITVMTPVLDIQNLNCFPTITDGGNQSCSVFVKSDNGLVAGNVNVNIYYTNGTLFGTCKTDALSGACEVETPVYGVGTYTVYAIASAQGYISDNDTYPRFKFDVYTQKYAVINLGTYNDSNFFYPQDTFYRGQPLYVKFQVYDSTNNDFVTKDIVTAASLVSLPGGRADLSRITYNGDWYYYSLDAIPLTHDFLGNSNVFAFAFNFTGLTSGQAQVHLTILNNKPKINNIADVYVRVGSSYSIFLNNYGTDLEDKTLNWNIQSTPTLFSASINPGNALSITGLNVGTESLVLRGYDLDNDFAETNIAVHVIPAITSNNLTASCSVTQNSGNAPFNAQFNSQVSNAVGTYSYEWSFGDGNVVNNNLGSTSHTYSNSGTYSVSLLVTDSVNNIAVANCGHIAVNNFNNNTNNTNNTNTTTALIANIGGPYNGYINEALTFDASASTGNILDYRWDFGDGTIVDSLTPLIQHTYKNINIYPVTLTIFDANYYSSSASTTATVIERTTSKNITLRDVPDKGLIIKSLVLYGDYGEILKPNDELTAQINLKNDWDTKLKNIRIIVSIPELGIEARSSQFDLGRGNEISQAIMLPMYDVAPGVYNVRISIDNDDGPDQVRRVKYREIVVKK